MKSTNHLAAAVTGLLVYGFSDLTKEGTIDLMSL
jgi:hypothetical protein